MTLKKQTVSGIAWTFLDFVINKAIYFIATILLARLLGPSDFGLIGMIMLFFTIGATLVESGLSTSLIRTINPDESDYSTIFYMNILMSSVAYLLVFVIAPYVAAFYHQPIIISIIRIYCLGFIVTAFRMVQQSQLIKQFKFKVITFLNLPSNLIGFAVGMFMAYNNYGVWSIVGLYISTQISSTLIYWFYCKWRPKLIFSEIKMKHHFNFGYKLMFSALLNTIFDNLYNVLLGKFYNLKVLGYYERANTLSNYPVSILSGIISKVTLPLLSNIKENREKIQIVYRKILLLSFFISAPIMMYAFSQAKPIVETLLGKQWLPIVPMFRILCIGNMFFPIHSLNINLLSIFGKSNLFLKIEIIKKIILVTLVIIGFQFGVFGLLWSSVLFSLLSLFVNTYYSGDIISYSTKKQFYDLIPTILSSLLMLLSIFMLSFFMINSSNFLQLFLSAMTGGVVYFFAALFMKNESLSNLLSLLYKKAI
jgi:O-antigen/teichoic acid export membrane protein